MTGAPLSPHDIVLGLADSPTTHPQVRLTPADQAYHSLLWGSTGTGKSMLLASLFLQHLTRGHGIALIEPHSDLSLTCLAYLVGRGYFEREGAFDDLIYIDFGHGTYAPLNLLQQPYDPHTVALNVLDALTRTWPDLQNAPLFKTLFLSSALTLTANHLPLTGLFPLLLDSDFRDACLMAVEDPVVHQAFAHYGRLGKGQAGDSGSTLRRAFLLSFMPTLRFCLSQPENLDFRRLMDEGRGLIINVGTVADQITQKLLGAMLMVQIERAALSRMDTAPALRTPFTLLVDEWPSFAAQAATIENILVQARKFHLRLYLAGQSLAQVGSDRLAGALEQCRCSVTFRLGRDSAEIQAKHIGHVDPYQLKVPPFLSGQRPHYMSFGEQRENWVQELQNLPNRRAYVKIAQAPATKIKTLTVRPRRIPEGALEEVLAEYRRRYQRTEEAAQQAIERAAPALAARLSMLATTPLGDGIMLDITNNHDDDKDNQPTLAELVRDED